MVLTSVTLDGQVAKHFITGYGLCNFCAEGGVRGYSHCFNDDGWFLCSGGADGVRCQASGGWSVALVSMSINMTECGPHRANCGFSQFAPGQNTGIGWRDGASWISIPWK
jgi:hypothetical protein